MFEVRGWKVTAPLKTDTSAAVKQPPVPDGEQPATTVQTKSKKRKRAGDSTNAVQVTADNLADVWQEHIEGIPKKSRKDSDVNGSSQTEKRDKRALSTEAGSKLQRDNVSAETQRSKRPSSGLKEEVAKRQKDESTPREESNGVEVSKPAMTAQPSTTTAPKLTALQSKMSHKLASARFRHLNQQLYTTPSSDSLSLFATNPDMFTDYHAGFAQQVDVWPENPVDSYIADITARGKIRGPPAGKSRHNNDKPKEVTPGQVEPLPRIRDRGFQCSIADLGCGTAKLASSLQPVLKKLNLKFHSFDLHAPNKFVTAADIAHLPLVDGSIDVAIACLALMGTNWIEFVEEAWRVLRWKGEFWIAEIKSRFSRSSGSSGTGPAHSISKRQMKKQGLVGKEGAKKDKVKQEKENEEQLAVEVDGVEASGKGETDVGQFVKVFERRGFVLEGAPDLSNKMFVKMKFVKAAAPAKGKYAKPDAAKGKKFVENAEADEFDEQAVLKPCVYKLR